MHLQERFQLWLPNRNLNLSQNQNLNLNQSRNQNPNPNLRQSPNQNPSPNLNQRLMTHLLLQIPIIVVDCQYKRSLTQRVWDLKRQRKFMQKPIPMVMVK